MNKYRIKSRGIRFIAILTIMLFSFSIIVAQAQYVTEQTVDVSIPSSGVFHVDTYSPVGVSIDIEGTPGATGSVSIVVYLGNPQPEADIPENVSLSHFIVVTFNMAASDFRSAKITISYTDADVEGIVAPYSLYKYMPESNSYTLLPATIDAAAKTITATLTSTTDPLFAIGGVPAANATQPFDWGPTVSLVIVVFEVVVVVVILTLLVLRRRRKQRNELR